MLHQWYNILSCVHIYKTTTLLWTKQLIYVGCYGDNTCAASGLLPQLVSYPGWKRRSSFTWMECRKNCWYHQCSPILTWIPYRGQLIEFPDSTCMLLGTKLKMRYIFSISEFRAVTVIHYRSEGWTHWFMQLDSCESFNRRASYVDIVAYNLDQGNQRKFKYTLECSRGRREHRTLWSWSGLHLVHLS